MSEHARLSPSSSARWFACPGSITLGAAVPDKSSGYADAGTACHDVAAWCLTEHFRAAKRIGDYVKVSRGGEPERKVQFDESMADDVQGYVDTVRALGIGNTLLVEQRIDFSDSVQVPGQFGTADSIVVNNRDGELMVIDAKFGHTPVDVEENSQLMLYALGALNLLYGNTGLKIVPVAAEPEGDLW